MAGTEGEGIGAARPELFDSALWILTPTASTNSSAFRKINEIVAGLGASWMALDPDEHDRLVALVSHLPYALATCLMQMAARRGDERVFRAAAGSFRDVTRTAGSNAAIWRDILAANRSAVLDQLDTFIATITDFRASLEAGDFESLDAAIAEARAARSRFPVKGERQPGQPVTLDISVPDRTGVLAEITTTVGDLGINIEDLWMQHGPAGGTVRLVVDGQDAADAVVAALHTLEYRIQKVDEL